MTTHECVCERAGEAEGSSETALIDLQHTHSYTHAPPPTCEQSSWVEVVSLQGDAALRHLTRKR